MKTELNIFAIKKYLKQLEMKKRQFGSEMWQFLRVTKFDRRLAMMAL
jgi:hypothetical protein